MLNLICNLKISVHFELSRAHHVESRRDFHKKKPSTKLIFSIHSRYKLDYDRDTHKISLFAPDVYVFFDDLT